MTDAPDWTLDAAPVAPFMSPRSAFAPGIGPLEPEAWLFPAADFAGQMRLRDRLIAERPQEVLAVLPEGEAAAAELAEMVAEEVLARHGAARLPGAIRRPDGVEVPLDLPPMTLAGRLAQEDFLIMDRPEGAPEHVLTAGVLCFPAHWRLDEKIGKPLVRIHLPVPEYPGDLAARVQRFFDGVKVGRPLTRANWHFAGAPELWTPAHEAEKMVNFTRRLTATGEAGWLRVERQTVLRMPRTNAVVFGVRTLMTPLDALTPEHWRAVLDRIAEAPEHDRARKASPALLARARATAGAEA